MGEMVVLCTLFDHDKITSYVYLPAFTTVAHFQRMQTGIRIQLRSAL